MRGVGGIKRGRARAENAREREGQQVVCVARWLPHAGSQARTRTGRAPRTQGGVDERTQTAGHAMNRAVVILYGISVVAFLVVLFRRVCEDEASLDEVERRRSRNPETVE